MKGIVKCVILELLKEAVDNRMRDVIPAPGWDSINGPAYEDVRRLQEIIDKVKELKTDD